MKLANLIVLLLIINAPFSIFGQQQFTTEEGEKFCKIYLESKSNNIAERSNSIIQMLQKHNVSATRYKEIINHQLLADQDKLTPNELELIKEIEQKNKQLEESKLTLITQKCQEYGLSEMLYKEMLIQYRTDIEFQRALKPFMDKQIQGR